MKTASAKPYVVQPAGGAAESHTYPGTGHWFFENDRADAYRPEAAELAWRRTVAFLGTCGGES